MNIRGCLLPVEADLTNRRFFYLYETAHVHIQLDWLICATSFHKPIRISYIKQMVLTLKEVQIYSLKSALSWQMLYANNITTECANVGNWLHCVWPLTATRIRYLSQILLIRLAGEMLNSFWTTIAQNTKFNNNTMQQYRITKMVNHKLHNQHIFHRMNRREYISSGKKCHFSASKCIWAGFN